MKNGSLIVKREKNVAPGFGMKQKNTGSGISWHKYTIYISIYLSIPLIHSVLYLPKNSQ